MENNQFEVEPATPFSDSLIWNLNRKYYEKNGLDAWRTKVVPHHLTSNSLVGKTYAELIFAFLKDLAAKGDKEETVYILELGAGHGRLAFHILKHLEILKQALNLDLPPFCYVLSDFVEDNLIFFQNHPQFKLYIEQGLLEVAHFDAIESREILLRCSKRKIAPAGLNQPLLIIANYFFDSIPSDLFQIKNHKTSTCSIALHTLEDPKEMDEATLLKKLRFVYHLRPVEAHFYKDPVLNDILEAYRANLEDTTFLFFPHRSLQCLNNLQSLTKKGIMVLSIDKGFTELQGLQTAGEPELITHGSFSVWVNFHAMGEYCKKQFGNALFTTSPGFYLQLACLMFLPESDTFVETKAAYQRFVNGFGPDDFNGLKRQTYRNIRNFKLPELIAFLRLSAYDSTVFENILPRLKQLSVQLTFNERRTLSHTMHQIWKMYFNINEAFDLAYELAGLFYDLGYYSEALLYFGYSKELYGQKADIYYNKALCYYHLRKDVMFVKTLEEGKLSFPKFEKFAHLETLDLKAI